MNYFLENKRKSGSILATILIAIPYLTMEFISNDEVSASFKFIQKLWKLNSDILNKVNSVSDTNDANLRKAVNKTIYNVTKNLDNFQYNVVIANIHEIYNLIYNHVHKNNTSSKTLKNEC